MHSHQKISFPFYWDAKLTLASCSIYHKILFLCDTNHFLVRGIIIFLLWIVTGLYYTTTGLDKTVGNLVVLLRLSRCCLHLEISRRIILLEEKNEDNLSN